MSALIEILIVLIAVSVAIAHRHRAIREAGQDAGVGTLVKMLLGLVLPLAGFIVCLGLIQQSQNAKSPDFGTVGGFKSLIVLLFGVPTILVVNSILMARTWKNVMTVCLVGCIAPALLVIVDLCFVAVGAGER